MKSVGVIGVALASASILGLVFLGVVARWLTPDQNATFVSLWGLVFAGGSVLSVIEQETARQSTVAERNGVKVPSSVGQLAVIGLLGSFLALLVVYLLPFGSTVFGTNLALVALTYVAFSGFAVQFLFRGVFLGQHMDGLYALVIFAEAAVRVVAIGIIIVLGASPTPLWALVATVVGSLGWVPVLRHIAGRVSWREGREPWLLALKRVGVLAVGNAFLAGILTGYPTVTTAVIGSSAGLAVFFVIVTVSRVPLVLLSPVQALVIPVTTRALHNGRADLLAAMQRKLALGLAIGSTVAFAGGWALGPWAIRLLFGSQYDAPAWLVAVMLAATVILAGAILQASVFVSLQRYSLMVVTWGSALGSAVLAIMLTPGSATIRGTAGFVVAGIVGYVASVIALRRALSTTARGEQSPGLEATQ